MLKGTVKKRKVQSLGFLGLFCEGIVLTFSSSVFTDFSLS